MEDQSGAYKSLGGVGKTISIVGWVVMGIGVVFAIRFPFHEDGKWIAVPILLMFGFFVIISGQVISCFVAVARNTETTNNILTRQTELFNNILTKQTELLEIKTIEKGKRKE